MSAFSMRSRAFRPNLGLSSTSQRTAWPSRRSIGPIEHLGDLRVRDFPVGVGVVDLALQPADDDRLSAVRDQFSDGGSGFGYDDPLTSSDLFEQAREVRFCLVDVDENGHGSTIASST